MLIKATICKKTFMIQDFISSNQTISGIILVIISLFFAIIYIRKIFKKSYNFEDFGILNWQAFIGTWVLILLGLILGFSWIIE